MSRGGHAAAGAASLLDVQAYWDARVDDTVLSGDAPGSRGYFAAMASHRYSKYGYLPKLIGFERWQGREVLDVGCGAGIDVARLARCGARVSGVDISRRSLSLASRNLAAEGQPATLAQADGARLPFRDASFDLVLCCGVLPFAPDPRAIVLDCRRVLREQGLAIFVAYNRVSLMSALRAVSAVGQGHGDAPVFRMHTRKELDGLLEAFAERQIQTAARGWHLVACCRKHRDPAAGSR
jgi:ubiquinone/menaquinone biosynthesis C-methylase UbiE